jgi:hypothetical protein
VLSISIMAKADEMPTGENCHGPLECPPGPTDCPQATIGGIMATVVVGNLKAQDQVRTNSLKCCQFFSFFFVSLLPIYFDCCGCRASDAFAVTADA